jgi:hypothetical protein
MPSEASGGPQRVKLRASFEGPGDSERRETPSAFVVFTLVSGERGGSLFDLKSQSCWYRG